MKQCKKCGKEITKYTYCSKECRESYYFNEYRLALGIDVGKGSGALSGKDNHRYKNGIGIVINGYNRLVKRSIRYCEICREDLKYSSRGRWGIHHKDHDRTNNDLSNLQLLCRSCHARHHKVWKNFEGATTSRKT